MSLPYLCNVNLRDENLRSYKKKITGPHGRQNSLKIRHMRCDVWGTMYEVRCMRYDVWGTMYDVWCVMYEVWCMRCEVWGVRYEVRCMRCDVWGVMYEVWRSKPPELLCVAYIVGQYSNLSGGKMKLKCFIHFFVCYDVPSHAIRVFAPDKKCRVHF